MDKIKSYIDRFLENTGIQSRYDMRQREWWAISENAKQNPVGVTGTAFLYGYAKGYRAAMAGIRKGGAA